MSSLYGLLVDDGKVETPSSSIAERNVNGFGIESDGHNVRTIFINQGERNASMNYLSNVIATSKYHLWTFVPLFLFEQFSRAANLFFLFIVFIQQVPDISPTGRFTTIVPLSFIMTVTAAKELIEDFRRHRMDKEVNNSTVKVLREGTFQTLKWTDVVVGDIVKVLNNNFFPADMVLLASSEPQAICYVETANLDGETNLKIRQGLQETGHVLNVAEARALRGVLHCELPNCNLYSFEGALRLTGEDNTSCRSIPINAEQLLLRGAQLRNTPWCYGLVVNTGHETKLMLNNRTSAPIRRSHVDRETDVYIVVMCVLLFSIAIFAAIAYVVWSKANRYSMWYLAFLDKGPQNAFKAALTFIILFNNLVPISLIVTLEIVKFVQALYINWDLTMYDSDTDTPASARTSMLNEELGLVEYVFSDKTGTLTCNVMEFKRCSVGGLSYGKPMALRDDDVMSGRFLDDPRLLENLTNGHATAPVIRELVTMAAVCHTVIPERDPNEEGRIIYQAQSPDEAALVEGVKALGFSFNIRTPESVTINALGADLRFEILHVLEFDSNRKRMSVVVRNPEGRIRLFCKGADSVIYERLSPNQPFAEPTLTHLEEYAREGLRTLCFAVAEIPDDVYTIWARDYEAARATLVDRCSRIAEVAERLEKNLFLLGATAIEDKLQEGVPNAIAALCDAGAHVWVLTGDRQETAINVGYSCRLLNSDMVLLVPDENAIMNDWIHLKLEELRGNVSSDNNSLALVIGGKALSEVMALKSLSLAFLELARMCRSIICCRVSPSQKADVVCLVRDNIDTVTLAIGDGANDVAMIQAAHIGVGISGKEGMQAARASDYSIAQFRFLKTLMLVHGARSYHRLSKVILYSFYKNISLYFVQFWFSLWNGYSGQTIYERWTIGLYNVMFTALPIIVIGVSDYSVNTENLLNVPQLYESGRLRKHFNRRTFVGWIANSFYHSFLLFYLNYLNIRDGVTQGNGHVTGLWFFGTLVYTCVLVTVTLKAAMITDSWTLFNHIFTWGSIVLWFIFLPIYCHVWPHVDVASELFNADTQLFRSGRFWLGLFVIPAIALIRDYSWKTWKRCYNPEPRHVIMEMQQLDVPVNDVVEAFSFRRIFRDIFLPGVRYVSHGFAFSQEERGQAELVRKYDTNAVKPLG